MLAAMRGRGPWWVLVGLVLGGCGSADPCGDLAEICAACPSQGLGPVAKDSCDRTVRTADEEECQTRLDDRTYEFLGGCVSPDE